MDAWRRGLKSRLRDVVQGEGSQRKLAEKVLGDKDKAPQVSEWCSPERDTVPGAENLHRLREKCGTDLNWLLCGEVPGEESGEWPAKRRAALEEELGQYALHVLSERRNAKRYAYTNPASSGPEARAITGILDPVQRVIRDVRGDFLKHFTADVERLVDEAAEASQSVADRIDATAYRRERRAALRKRR